MMTTTTMMKTIMMMMMPHPISKVGSKHWRNWKLFNNHHQPTTAKVNLEKLKHKNVKWRKGKISKRANIGWRGDKTRNFSKPIGGWTLKKRFTKYKVVEADNPPAPVGNLSVLTGKLLVGCRNPQSDSLQADFILILEMITRSYLHAPEKSACSKIERCRHSPPPPPFWRNSEKSSDLVRGVFPLRSFLQLSDIDIVNVNLWCWTRIALVLENLEPAAIRQAP